MSKNRNFKNILITGSAGFIGFWLLIRDNQKAPDLIGRDPHH